MSTDTAPDDELIIEIDPAELELVRTVADEHGVELIELDERGFVAEAAVVSLMLLGATAVFRRILEERRGGQVIDLRPGIAKERYRDSDLRHDIIEIRRADGTVEIQVAAVSDMLSEVLAALRTVAVDVAKTGIDTAVDAARAAVGNRATVRVKPTT